MMPPIAAIVPDIAKTMIRIFSIPIPARLAASTLPPTAKTWRPKRVFLARYVHHHHEADQDQQGERHAAVGVEDGDDDDRRHSHQDEAIASVIMPSAFADSAASRRRCPKSVNAP